MELVNICILYDCTGSCHQHVKLEVHNAYLYAFWWMPKYKTT